MTTIAAAATINARTADLIAGWMPTEAEERWERVKASEMADEAFDAERSRVDADLAGLAALIAAGTATEEEEYAYADLRKDMRFAHPDEYMPAPWGMEDYIPAWRR